MSNTKRTILILDYSLHARTRACYNRVESSGDGKEEVDDDLGLEPCSMWSSFVHAALHYTRLVWDLSPVGQKTQVSVHVAPGAATALDSIVLNGWLLEEQRLGNLTSQLKKLQSQDDMTSKRTDEDDSSLREWIKQALKGAIAHVLEPAPQQTVSNGSGGFQHRLLANIIMVLVDREGSIKKEGEDTEMNDEENQAWNYSGMDLRSILTEALHSLQECVRNSRVSNINVEFIRISTQLKKVHADIVREDISRVCSASVYTVAAENETSTTRALTNHYLLQNKNIQSLRLRNLPLGDGDSSDPIDLFYRTDHITALALKKVDKHPQAMPTALLQDTPRTVLEATELRYGVECDKTSYILPTECAHLASISPSTFNVAFFPFIRGKKHLLSPLQAQDIASKALVDHNGQLFVHCLHTSKDSHMISSEQGEQPIAKRKLSTPANNYHLEEFVDAIIRPNTIMPGSDSFIQEGNMFTEIVPPALKPASMTQNAEGAEGANAENELSSQGVSMSLVHTTSKLDLETRWLVQWEGERVHPILPAHSSQIQRFKGAICRGSVDATGLNTITSILDTLIGDLRPVVLPGESAPVGQGIASQHQQRFRESAQAILADLWMVGQRFKSVSPSHVEAARLIATKITPKGLDHQTVRLTLVPPSRRAAMLSAEAQGNSPIVDSSDGAGDSWNRNKNQRGMGNAVSSGGIGRGGNRGGRFDNNRGRGGAGVGGGAGRGGRGGFRGNNGNNNSNNSPGGSNSNSANADDMNFNGMDPSGSTADIMLSMTGKTQPVPYLATQPPTREELEESEQEYLGQLGEDGCLLKAYWGTRGAQGSAIASVLNSVTSLDAPSVYTSLLSTDIPPTIAPTMDPLAAAALAAQQKLKKLSTKRPRLQDFAGRTPVSENGGYSK